MPVNTNIYAMELHETISLSSIYILRVPGGWIYTNYSHDPPTSTSVFVPKDMEFIKVDLG
jgi:hypothetical protein